MIIGLVISSLPLMVRKITISLALSEYRLGGRIIISLYQSHLCLQLLILIIRSTSRHGVRGQNQTRLAVDRNNSRLNQVYVNFTFGLMRTVNFQKII